MTVKLSLEELVQIRSSIGSEIDILDAELDDTANRASLDIPRGRELRKRETLTNILVKVHNAIHRDSIFTDR